MLLKPVSAYQEANASSLAGDLNHNNQTYCNLLISILNSNSNHQMLTPVSWNKNITTSHTTTSKRFKSFPKRELSHIGRNDIFTIQPISNLMQETWSRPHGLLTSPTGEHPSDNQEATPLASDMSVPKIHRKADDSDWCSNL